MRLREIMELASEQVIYLPVQRQNIHGGQMVPDMIAALPIETWESMIEAADNEVGLLNLPVPEPINRV